jgi:hypothetical protein
MSPGIRASWRRPRVVVNQIRASPRGCGITFNDVVGGAKENFDSRKFIRSVATYRVPRSGYDDTNKRFNGVVTNFSIGVDLESGVADDRVSSDLTIGTNDDAVDKTLDITIHDIMAVAGELDPVPGVPFHVHSFDSDVIARTFNTGIAVTDDAAIFDADIRAVQLYSGSWKDFEAVARKIQLDIIATDGDSPGAVLGTVALGRIFDLSSSYRPAFALCATCAVVGVAATLGCQKFNPDSAVKSETLSAAVQST